MASNCYSTKKFLAFGLAYYSFFILPKHFSLTILGNREENLQITIINDPFLGARSAARTLEFSGSLRKICDEAECFSMFSTFCVRLGKFKS